LQQGIRLYRKDQNPPTSAEKMGRARSLGNPANRISQQKKIGRAWSLNPHPVLGLKETASKRPKWTARLRSLTWLGSKGPLNMAATLSGPRSVLLKKIRGSSKIRIVSTGHRVIECQTKLVSKKNKAIKSEASRTTQNYRFLRTRTRRLARQT